MSYGRKMNIFVKGERRIDGLKEVENETWEQTEQILKKHDLRKTRK